MEIKKGMSLNDLIQLAQTSPEHKQLYMGLANIDVTTTNLVKNIILSIVNDSSQYYVKTEFQNQCYTLFIYNSVQQATIGYSWALADFLMLCSNKMLEHVLNTTVQKMINKFDDKGVSSNRINWLI